MFLPNVIIQIPVFPSHKHSFLIINWFVSLGSLIFWVAFFFCHFLLVCYTNEFIILSWEFAKILQTGPYSKKLAFLHSKGRLHKYNQKKARTAKTKTNLNELTSQAINSLPGSKSTYQSSYLLNNLKVFLGITIHYSLIRLLFPLFGSFVISWRFYN